MNLPSFWLGPVVPVVPVLLDFFSREVSFVCIAASCLPPTAYSSWPVGTSRVATQPMTDCHPDFQTSLFVHRSIVEAPRSPATAGEGWR